MGKFCCLQFADNSRQISPLKASVGFQPGSYSLAGAVCPGLAGLCSEPPTCVLSVRKMMFITAIQYIPPKPVTCAAQP